MNNNICKIEGCNGKHNAKGFCKKHYLRFKRHGDPLYTEYTETCSVDNCENKHYGLGYCQNHYKKYLRNGDPLITKLHGMADSPEYAAWTNMKQRCFNPKSKNYHRYGGRGITVCNEWKDSFMEFYKDMGAKPFPEAELDRIDDDRGYILDNCRWVSGAVNVRNRNVTRLSIEKVREIRIEYSQGNTSYRKLAKKYNIEHSSIGAIIRNELWKDEQ